MGGLQRALGRLGVARGHEGVRQAWRRWFEVFGDVEWNLDGDPVPVGDDVVATYRVQGRGRGSGVEFEQRLSLVWTVSGQQVTRVRAYLERDQALVAASDGA